MDRPVAVFFHGLNTFGDDLLHLGPVTLGRMDRYLQPALEQRGIKMVSIDKMGAGSPESQALLASRQLARLGELGELKPGSKLVLLGNSLGGLVARALAHFWNRNPETNVHRFQVPAILTWGTPHRGTRAADFPAELARAFPRGYPAFEKALAQAGYKLGEKSATFEFYSPGRLEEFNSRHPMLQQTKELSFLCSVAPKDVSPYFWSLYPPLHGLSYFEFARRLTLASDPFEPSDGFISNGSQSRGEERGPYRLDHFVQMGFVELLPTPSKRLKASLEFERLINDMASEVKRRSTSSAQ